MSTEKMDATGRTVDGKKHTASLEHAVKFASWPTPMAGTPAQKGYNEAGNTDSSRKTVLLASWMTPTTRDHKDGSSEGTVPVNGLLGRQVWAAGSGSPAATGKLGRLNPAFSLWLMIGPLATAWLSCVPPGTRSTSKRRGNSSEP
jgi:hypothetical protein